jgi:diguanylate cyclase (GGDEF)-like protein/PAS domain S-box-containing protein
MRRRLTLKWVLPLGLAATLLLITGLSTLSSLLDTKAKLASTSRAELLNHTAHLARMMEKGLQGSRSLVEADVGHVSSDRRVTAVLILDNTGRILLGHRRAWHDQLAAEKMTGFDDAWRQKATDASLPELRASADGLHMEVMQPFNLPANQTEIRSSRRGVVFVRFDLMDTWQTAKFDALVARLPSLAAILLVLLGVAWLLQRQVARPLARLGRAASALAQGRLDTRVAVGGPAEIAALSADFNAMASALQHNQATLAANEKRLAITLHAIGDGLIATDAQGHVNLMNPAAERFTGWLSHEALGRPIAEVFKIESALTGEPAEIPVARVLQEGVVVGLANHTVLVSRQGARHDIADTAAPIVDSEGAMLGVVLVFQDVTGQYKMRKALADSEAHFRTLANSGQALSWTEDIHQQSDYFNDTWLRFTGRTLEQELGSGWTEGIHPDDLDRCLRPYQAAVLTHAPFQAEYRHRNASGEYRWLLNQGSPRFDSEGTFLGYVGHCLDITEAKRSEAEIARLAYHDALTGLPNRALFQDRLDQSLAAARRAQRFGALMFVDLDQFKRLNDVYGHALGDAVLVEVAQRLSYYLRHEDTVARLGGDEFVVLLPDLALDTAGAATLALAVAEKIRLALESPIHIQNQIYTTAASIGITLFPKGDESVDDLMREADIAMYRAKESGRNAISYFERDMQDAVTQRYALEQDLREAVRQQAFELHLQSQVNTAGTLMGAEALVRWRHPTRGLISPASFIPLAEESRLIVPLGEWVLRQACEVIAQLDAAGHNLHIAVNVSPRQFQQPNFVLRVKEILSLTGADPTHLTLEITEGLLVDHVTETMGRMAELAALGIRFSIDDFGTGYSSLAYLKRLPLFELKIDKSFVQDIPTDPNDVALVQTILAMSRHLHLQVVAEGVETAEQFEFLKAQGCDRFQGYYFHRPQPQGEWLAQRV